MLGAIAQLGERCNGIAEVVSSILSGSTKASLNPFSPHRLEAQDTALSRRRRGFESPWGRHYSGDAKNLALSYHKAKMTDRHVKFRERKLVDSFST